MSTPSEESGHRGQLRPFGQWANGATADGAHAKKQAAAALWLAHHLLPGVRYREEEVDWLISTRCTRAKVRDGPLALFAH